MFSWTGGQLLWGNIARLGWARVSHLGRRTQRRVVLPHFMRLSSIAGSVPSTVPRVMSLPALVTCPPPAGEPRIWLSHPSPPTRGLPSVSSAPGPGLLLGTPLYTGRRVPDLWSLCPGAKSRLLPPSWAPGQARTPLSLSFLICEVGTVIFHPHRVTSGRN